MTANLDPLAIVADDKPKQDYSGVNWQTLEQQRLAGNPFAISSDLAEQIRQGRQETERVRGFEFGIGEDKFQDERQNQGFIETALGSQVRAGDLGRLKELQDTQTANMLRQAGLQPVYEQDQYRGYQYNPATGGYEYYDYAPSMLDVAIPALIKAGVMGVATGGLGGALSSGLGVSSGVGKAIASAGLRGMFGEDINLENIAKDYFAAEALGTVDKALGGIDTGYESLNEIIKSAGGDIIRGKDPKEAILKAVVKNVGMPEELEQWGRDFDDNYLQPIKNALNEAFSIEGDSELLADIDQVIRDLPTTKEDWQSLEDAYHENIEDPLEELAGTVSDMIPDVDLGLDFSGLSGSTPRVSLGTTTTGVGSPSKADLVNIALTSPELVEGFDLSNPLLSERTV